MPGINGIIINFAHYELEGNADVSNNNDVILLVFGWRHIGNRSRSFKIEIVRKVRTSALPLSNDVRIIENGDFRYDIKLYMNIDHVHDDASNHDINHLCEISKIPSNIFDKILSQLH